MGNGGTIWTDEMALRQQETWFLSVVVWAPRYCTLYTAVCLMRPSRERKSSCIGNPICSRAFNADAGSTREFPIPSRAADAIDQPSARAPWVSYWVHNAELLWLK